MSTISTWRNDIPSESVEQPSDIMVVVACVKRACPLLAKRFPPADFEWTEQHSDFR